jgi:hypothetical protein
MKMESADWVSLVVLHMPGIALVVSLLVKTIRDMRQLSSNAKNNLTLQTNHKSADAVTK